MPSDGHSEDEPSTGGAEETAMMTNCELGRVVCRHEWRDLSEWVRALDDLASLSDGEIEAIAGGEQARPQAPSGR
jgi:hypothetical protein